MVAPVPQSATRGVRVTVKLPLRNADQLDALIARQGDPSSGDFQRFISPDQFRATYGPTATDLQAAAKAMQGMGFQTTITSQAVLATAPQETVESAFRVRLALNTKRTALSVGRGFNATVSAPLVADKAPTVPDALKKLGATVGIGGFVHQVHSHKVSSAPVVPANRFGPNGPYFFDDLKQAYQYPSNQALNGAGRKIAIVISSDVLDSDTAAYFGFEGVPAKPIVRRPVDGGPAAFDPNSGASAEASLDVQQSQGSALGATVMLYGIPQLDDGSILDAYTAIVDDNQADVVSSSFGLCELFYTAAYNQGQDFTFILRDYHDIFRQGNAQGISWVASSGDSGAFSCTDPTFSFFIKGVSHPAADPDVTAVGGTNLITVSRPNSLNSRYVSENAFFDTFDDGIPNDIWGSGGGISQIFSKPLYQFLVNTGASTRTIPDVSMHMGGCPVGVAPTADCSQRSSVVTAIGGQFFLLIGTSASSPEFAGLLAVTEQCFRGLRLGNANFYIYANAGGSVYHNDIPGNNGYPTTHGYNYVLGNGTPKAARFMHFDGPLAGIPQTPSNP